MLSQITPRHAAIATLVCGAFLVLGMGPMPLPYYRLLRIVVSASFLILAVVAHRRGKTTNLVVCICMAILFNPILPVANERDEWTILDIGALVALIYTWDALPEDEKRRPFGLPVLAGIAALPITFAWLANRVGHSRPQRFLAFTWMAIWTCAMATIIYVNAPMSVDMASQRGTGLEVAQTAQSSNIGTDATEIQAEAVLSDLVVTDALLNVPPGVDALKQAPTRVSTCKGGGLSISNGSQRSINLSSTPEASDAAATIGTIQPGSRMQLTVEDDPGTYYIQDLDSGEYILMYEVRDCPVGNDQTDMDSFQSHTTGGGVSSVSYADLDDYAPPLVGSAAGDVYVRGYQRADGTEVSGHYRSAHNDTRSDNWTTVGNVNPHTGEIGTR